MAPYLGFYPDIWHSVGRVGQHLGAGYTDGVRIGVLYLHGGILGPSRPNASETTNSTEPHRIYALEAQGC